MAANYLHGVETIEIETGPRPVKAVKSAVIGLIGTAPCGPVNQPMLCLSESDAAQFGPAMANFTIPQALKAIYDHGAGTVVVINVLNPAVHKSTIPNEVVKVDDNGLIQLKHGAVQTMSIGRNTSAGNAYVKGTDYTIDMLTGKITCMGNNLKPGVQAYVNYTYADPTKVVAADIVGEVNTAGDRTGMKLLQDTWNQFGFYAKILIAPVFCTQNSVAVKLIAQAEALGAITYIDAPIGTTFQQVLAGRGPRGSINFNTSSDRVRLCYPHVKVYDSATDSEVLEPLSSRAAAWPTVTHMRNFENVRRTGDVINESIRYFSQQYMDMPINQALIDALTESVNTWGRKLIADGALLGFECWYDPARNEQTELAAGHLLLSYKFTPPPPLERLTFETEITSEYLVSLESNR